MAEQQTHFNIGQIIYILSNKSQSVVPAIVAEEDFRKVRKLDGVHEVVNYKLCIGPKDRQRIVSLSQIDGEVYMSLEDIRAHLIQRLTAFVDDLVSTTLGNVQKWYGVTANNQVLESSPNETGTEPKLDPGDIIHAVNNNIPLQAQGQTHPLQLNGGVQQPQAQAVNPHMSLRDNIRQMVIPEEEDPMQGLGLNQGQHPSQQYVILPDGTRAPLRQG